MRSKESIENINFYLKIKDYLGIFIHPAVTEPAEPLKKDIKIDYFLARSSRIHFFIFQ